jgi:hypothetical protein
MGLRQVLAIAAVLAATAGCDSGQEAHVFYASRYDPATGCLGSTDYADVLSGADPGDCDQVVCWLDTKGNAFISATMCDGPPDWTRVDKPAAGSVCEAALKAWAQYGAGQCAPEAGAEGGDAAGG